MFKTCTSSLLHPITSLFHPVSESHTLPNMKALADFADTRKRCQVYEVLEEHDGEYPSYAASSKRICTTGVKASSHLISVQEFNDLGIKSAIDPKLFSYSYQAHLDARLAVIKQSMKVAREKKNLNKHIQEVRDEAQMSKSECEALSQQVSETKDAAAKEVQEYMRQKDDLTGQLKDRKIAIAAARSQKKVVGVQRKKAVTAVKQTQFWRMMARNLATGLRKNNKRLQNKLDDLQLRSTDTIEKERRRTEKAQAEVKSMKATLKAYEASNRDVDMQDAEPGLPDRRDLESKLSAAEDSNFRLMLKLKEYEQQQQSPSRVVASSYGIPTPQSADKVDTTMEEIAGPESEQTEPFEETGPLQQNPSRLTSTSESPFGCRTTPSNVDEDTASEPMSHCESDYTVPEGTFGESSYFIDGQELFDGSCAIYKPESDDPRYSADARADMGSEMDHSSPPIHATPVQQSTEQSEDLGRSPYALDSSADTIGHSTGDESVVDLESEHGIPAGKSKADVRYRHQKGRSSGSQTGKYGRSATVGISKHSKPNRNLQKGHERHAESSVLPAAISRNKTVLQGPKTASSNLVARYPRMKAVEDVVAKAAPTPIKVAVPTVKAPASSEMAIPSNASKLIRDIELQEEYIEASTAYLDQKHKNLRAEGQAGRFYEHPGWNSLAFFAPHGKKKVWMARINRSEIQDSSKNWFLPAIEHLNSVDKDDAQYERACIIAQLPETHAAAVRIFEEKESAKKPDLVGLEARFQQRSPYRPQELWEVPKFSEKVHQIFLKTAKELATLPAFQHAAVAWADGKVSTDACWPPMFSDPFIKQKTSDPKNWIRRELDDLANIMRLTSVDNSTNSMLSSLDSISVDGAHTRCCYRVDRSRPTTKVS